MKKGLHVVLGLQNQECQMAGARFINMQNKLMAKKPDK